MDAQQKILSGEVILNSLRPRPGPSEKKDKEELLGGVVVLGMLDLAKGGVGVNLAELVRKARSLFPSKQPPQPPPSGDEE